MSPGSEHLGQEDDDGQDFEEGGPVETPIVERYWPEPTEAANTLVESEPDTRSVPMLPAEKVKYIGEDAPTWCPVPSNWLLFRIHPSFSAKARTVNSEGKFCTTLVDNVQIRLDEQNFS